MKLIYCFARRKAQLEHPCKENNQHPPQGSRKLLCGSGQGGPCRLHALASPDKANASMPNYFAPA